VVTIYAWYRDKVFGATQSQLSGGGNASLQIDTQVETGQYHWVPAHFIVARTAVREIAAIAVPFPATQGGKVLDVNHDVFEAVAHANDAIGGGENETVCHAFHAS
jgi:hypothetical protein